MTGIDVAFVEFQVLGPIEAMVSGRPANLGTPKQRALLALLVSRIGQPVDVDLILQTLWGGNPPPSAMTSLQAYVANLRRALEPERMPRTPAAVLRTCPGGYLLDGRVVGVDARRFGEHASAGWRERDRGEPHRALEEFDAALALWRGQAFAEVAGLAHVVPEVERLTELRLSVVEARCATLLDLGAHEVAVPDLEALIRAHPLREYGAELLSRTLHRTGRHSDALAVLQTIERRLADEVGIDPGPALVSLRNELLEQRPDPVRLLPDADTETFVGREPSLQRLAAAAAAATTGQGRVMTVSGEPGIGKTSLLRHFAVGAGLPVLWGTCPEHVAVPALWPWERILHAAVAAVPQHPVPPAIAELVGEENRPLVATDTLPRFEAIVRYLLDVSRVTPLVVVFDHLHRADPDSLRLLAHLAESVRAGRLLLIVSYRPGEAGGLAEVLPALARAGSTHLELGGLDTAEAEALTSAVLGRPVSRRTVDGLWSRTEGNPFFLREMIEHRSDEVPVRVRDVVLRRVARLPAGSAELLSVAATAGRQFDIAVIAEAAAVDIEVALEAMDAAVAAGLVVEDDRRLGWFRFTHPTISEVLYETTGRLRRVRRHLRIGAAAARAWADDPDLAAETAHHWLSAAELDPGVAARAVAHAETAAGIAAANLAFDDAAELWQRAMAAADLAGSGECDRYPLLMGLGTALCRAGNHYDGLPNLVEAVQEALAAYGTGTDRDASRLVRAAVAAVGELHRQPVGSGVVDRQLVDVFERALSRLGDPVPRSLLRSCLAVVRNRRGDQVRSTPVIEAAPAA
ncbi:AAA family ATPase [Actinoplanes sp. LDG1-06]|uniref:AAA family ATPase n=1 Tax=Paractinoplanes ovalisporus TaxID=2810368 RepID=A0ABS2AV84_9ACTN|nr:BTAD domain-containing putative transcriptional regulator [Actinoplanes ovalisporus]MBM2623650.1 AAA family ATPase [Actinoplanes ovalisporus]